MVRYCCASSEWKWNKKRKYWSVWPWIPMWHIFIINLRFYGNWSKWKDPNRQTTPSGSLIVFYSMRSIDANQLWWDSIECKRCPLYRVSKLYVLSIARRVFRIIMYGTFVSARIDNLGNWNYSRIMAFVFARQHMRFRDHFLVVLKKRITRIIWL